MTKSHIIHLSLFILTCITVTLAGAEWMFGRSFIFGDQKLGWEEFKQGLHFTIPFLGFLTTHEFGHYFAAKRRKVAVTLPYYIPFWLGIVNSIGTFGAFIRIKEVIKTKRNYFDIGVAGPLAGFGVALLVLIYGYANLPPMEYIFQIHPEYEKFGENYGEMAYIHLDPMLATRVGDSWLSLWIKNTFADPSLIPHPNEVIHYPYILAGFLGLFFTALNLLPIGQLDGGHILFSLIGARAFNRVSPVIFICFTTFAGTGFYHIAELSNVYSSNYLETIFYFFLYVYFIYLCVSRISKNKWINWSIALGIVFIQLGSTLVFPEFQGYSGFLPFSFLLGRLLGIYHPPVRDRESLGIVRTVIGWLALLIFVLCFSPYPFY